MSESSEIAVEYLNWNKARDYIINVNPELAAIIDAWDPDDSFGFYKATYRYGDLLSDEGELCLPMHNKGLVLLSDIRVPASIKEDLGYSSFPISISIQKATEVFIELNQRVIPLALFPMGSLIGLLETLDPIESCCIRNIWTVSIGARSAFMLPKISDTQTHNKLVKEFNLTITKPNTAFEHFEVFKQLARSQKFSDKDWSCDILIMNKKWFERDYKNYHWLMFNDYLNEYMVRYSTYTRNKSTLDIMYQLFVKELADSNRKTFAHLFDTLKHMVSIMVGAAPGFRPVFQEDFIGPFTAIQKVYLDYYGLNYCPTVMAPHHYNFMQDTRPLYYSISQPTLFESFPRTRKLDSYIDDLYQLKSLFETFITLARKGKFRIEKTLLENAIKNTHVEYFHTIEEGAYTGIKPVKMMIDSDPTLTSVEVDNKIIKMKFPEVSSFVTSCVRLSSLHKKVE
jgi:hypothetical protein